MCLRENGCVTTATRWGYTDGGTLADDIVLEPNMSTIFSRLKQKPATFTSKKNEQKYYIESKKGDGFTDTSPAIGGPPL